MRTTLLLSIALLFSIGLLFSGSAMARGRTFALRTALERQLTLAPGETRVTVRLPRGSQVLRHGMFGLREVRYPGLELVHKVRGKVRLGPGWYDVRRASKPVGSFHVYTASGSLVSERRR